MASPLPTYVDVGIRTTVIRQVGGVEWCEKHQGVRNEDSQWCDMSLRGVDPDPTPCKTQPLFVAVNGGES